MTKLIFILLVALCLEAFGVVCLSSGLKQAGEFKAAPIAEVLRQIGRAASNPQVLIGVLFEAIFFGILLYLLSREDVSLIWPLTSLGFVITTLAARFYLQEQVSAVRWCGVLLIVLGAGFITYSEKAKARTPVPGVADSRIAPNNQ